MRGLPIMFLVVSVCACTESSLANSVPFGFDLTTVSQGESLLAAMKLGRSSIDGVIDVAKGLPKVKSCRSFLTSDDGVNLIGIVSSLNRIAKDYNTNDERRLENGDRQEIIKRLKLVEPALKEVARQVEVLRKTQKHCRTINVTLLVNKLEQVKTGLGTVDELSARSVDDKGSLKLPITKPSTE